MALELEGHRAFGEPRRNAGKLGAILVEPMLGSGGCIPAEAGFLQALRQAADETGAVLIFDEVMTSRMAAGGQQQRIGVTSDLTTLVCWPGLGSMMTVHFQAREPRRPEDIQPDPGLKELFFFDMLQRGFYLARHGMLALSLEIGEREIDGFVAAVAEFIESRRSLL